MAHLDSSIPIMPELPEVETLRRGLATLLPGRVVRHVELRVPKLLAAAPAAGLAALVGRSFRSVRRHGKLLVFDLGDLALVGHLRLTGQLVYVDGAARFAGGHPVPAFDAAVPNAMTHVVIGTDAGVLYLNDQRQFARLWLLESAAIEGFLAVQDLGPCALDPALTPRALGERLARHARLPIKGALLDQRCLAGLGNIYADESLFLAGIHPAQPAGTLDAGAHERLLAGVRQALRVALAHGGAVVINGRALPIAGKDFLAVHGRAGEPCRRCGTPIAKTRVVGRGTYLCPSCQILPIAMTATADAAG
jgi:formamidopyrimidine-DNA glycosylase